MIEPRTLRSPESEAILNSVKKTIRAVVVQEGWPYCGLRAQIADTIQLRAFDCLDAPILRVTGADVLIPWAKNLEHLCQPEKARVRDALHRVLYRK